MANNKHMVGRLAIEACRRFPEANTRSLARYLTRTNPAVFESEESARDAVKYYRGAKGRGLRKYKLFDRVQEIPKSLAARRVDWRIHDGKWLLMADLHIPFHDTGAIMRTITDAKAHGVTGVLILGDMQDAAALGFFDNPSIKRNFIREVEITIDFLDFLRSRLRNMPIIIQPGNHEERLETVYSRNAPELIDLPSSDMRTILNLDKRNIEMLSRRQRAIVKAKEEAGDLHVLHGHTLMRFAASPVSPARTVILKSKANVVVGHVHRASYQPEQTIGGRALACWSLGCLCDLSPDYNPDANNWNHAHAILEVRGTDWELMLRRHLRDGRIVGGM